MCVQFHSTQQERLRCHSPVLWFHSWPQILNEEKHQDINFHLSNNNIFNCCIFEFSPNSQDVYKYSYCGRVHTAVFLTIVLSLVNSSISSQKLREGSFRGHELLVRPHLGDLPLHHDQDQVSLRKVAKPMGHQHTCLHIVTSI